MDKVNWEETQQHFRDWWRARGIVLGQWGNGVIDTSGNSFGPPPVAASLESRSTDPEFLLNYASWDLTRRTFPADTLPLACPGLQTVELASYLGADMTFDEETIWYRPASIDPYDRNLNLDESNRWYVRMSETLSRQARMARGRFLPSLPALSPGLDVLAELRGTENFLMDLIERPGNVRDALEQIDKLFFDVYDRYYEHVRQPDGSSTFYYFMIWGPGRVTQLQCDVSAMISPGMFEEFALPGIRRICNALDYTLFHVDGPPMLKHVDLLLSVENLNAIEFTPGPGVPTGADPHWYDLYRSILDAGKSVQVVVSNMEHIEPLLSELGANGIYLLTFFNQQEQFEEAGRIISRYTNGSGTHR
jgi:hypothetical protein